MRPNVFLPKLTKKELELAGKVDVHYFESFTRREHAAVNEREMKRSETSSQFKKTAIQKSLGPVKVGLRRIQTSQL